MKTITTETLSSSIKLSETLGRAQESPERALALLDQASRLYGPAPVETEAAQNVSIVPGAILSAGLALPPRTWRSQITSISIHAAIIALLILITVPVVQEVKRPAEQFTLIAPRLEPYKPKLPALHVQPKQIVKNFVAPKALIKPPQVKLAIQPAPILKVTTAVASVQPLPKIEAPEPPPAPKPQIRAGVFELADLAKAAQGARQLKTGGFGDPHGVPATAQTTSPMMMAKLGGFDLPNGEAKGGAAGRSIVQGGFGGSETGTSSGTGHKGSLRTSGFGDTSGTGTTPGTGQAGSIRTSGFGDASTQSPGAVQHSAATLPSTTSAEILFKPKPAYTAEARNLKVEGQVSIEVVFLASGTVRVIRVLHGLGHGLDEAAEQAAQQVRFRPATRDGVAVDTNATLYITFQLT